MAICRLPHIRSNTFTQTVAWSCLIDVPHIRAHTIFNASWLTSLLSGMAQGSSASHAAEPSNSSISCSHGASAARALLFYQRGLQHLQSMHLVATRIAKMKISHHCKSNPVTQVGEGGRGQEHRGTSRALVH